MNDWIEIIKDAEKMYKSGKSLADIATHYKVSRQAVHQAFGRFQIQRRKATATKRMKRDKTAN